MALLLVFAGLVLLRVLLVGIGAALLIRPVRSCPACFHATLPIRTALLRPFPAYEWRWCPTCRWQALARVTPSRSAGPRPPVPAPPPPHGPGPERT